MTAAYDMDQSPKQFTRLSFFDVMVNRVFGLMVKIGLGLSHNFLLEFRGRKTGVVYSTPVNVLEFKSKKYLVAPRGDTQWVKNVIASRKGRLVKGTKRENIQLRPIADQAKAEILKAYLDTYKLTVQRYFPIPAGSPVKEFEPLAGRYPVFELTPDA